MNTNKRHTHYNNIKTIRYKIVKPSDISIPKSPPLISIEKIDKMTNKFHLKQLEKKYDDFLEKNQQILLLYNIIEAYVDIRDALTIKINKIERREKIDKMKRYTQEFLII